MVGRQHYFLRARLAVSAPYDAGSAQKFAPIWKILAKRPAAALGTYPSATFKWELACGGRAPPVPDNPLTGRAV